jgi:hypothetical protein
MLSKELNTVTQTVARQLFTVNSLRPTCYEKKNKPAPSATQIQIE